MFPEDKRCPDSAPSPFWDSENLVQLLGLLFKDLKDLTHTAHALQLCQESMASQTLLPASLPKPGVGIVNQPVAASSGPAGNGTVMETSRTVIKGSPSSDVLCFCLPPRSNWSTSGQANSLFLRCCSFLLRLSSLQLPGSQFVVGGNDVIIPLAKQSYRNLLLPPSCSRGDRPRHSLPFCLSPLFLNHMCWTLFC